LSFACKQDKKGDAAKVELTQGISSIYVGSEMDSKSQWFCFLKDKKMMFSMPISRARFSILDGVLVAADIEFDVRNLALQPKASDSTFIKMENGLKDSLFFDVQNHQIGRLVLLKMEQKSGISNATHLIEAELSLLSVTKKIQFPAYININNEQLTFSAPTIDMNLSDWYFKIKEKKTNAGFDLTIVAKKE
jgi:hypothetical protein